MAGKKLAVCVIFGGQSSEHEVSRASAASVIRNLDTEKYRILKLGITKNGKWFLYRGKVEKIEDGSWERDKKNLKPAVLSPVPAHHGLLVLGAEKTTKTKVDVVFPVLHGAYGEDGTIQGLLELAKLPYVGCGVLASSVGMNKIYAKMAFDAAGLPQAKWVRADRDAFDQIDGIVTEVEKQLGYPCFVKPANAGSSVGITRAEDRATLIQGLHEAGLHDRQIVIEEAVVGREVECSVLGNQNAHAAAVGEVISAYGFYDYKEKYQTDTAQLCIPAQLPEETTQLIRERAVRAFHAIDGQGLSRVDFFVRQSDGEVVINEINTLPGFTSISMYAKLWQAVGLEYGPLLDRLIELALVREK